MKLETYRKQQQRTSGMLTSLRSRPRRRMLVATYATLCLLVALCAVLATFENTFTLGTIALLLLAAVTWTLIRITIDSEDQAPASALDEFQFERLEGYRAFAFRLFAFSLAAFAFYLLVRSAWFGSDMSSAEVSAIGFLMLVTALTIGCYPGLALAWNKSDED